MRDLFRSRDTAYRRPFGAVSAQTPVLMRVCLPRCWQCHAAFLAVEPDGGERRLYGMFWAGLAEDDREWWELHFTPEEPGLYWYAFRLELGLGNGWLERLPDSAAVYRPGEDAPGAWWQLTAYAADFTTPDWLAGGILYQIFPDRFCSSGTPKNGVPADRVIHERWDEAPVWRPDAKGKIRNNDFSGGDLAGITAKLDYLRSLGITCLYLNPIFESHSNHRYDTADYSRIDPMLGTGADLTALTAEAKKRGIRVLLDGVFSHTGADSVYFNREGRYGDGGAYRDPASPYAPWYCFTNWPREYRAWWGFDTLPEVEETSPAFLDYIAGASGIAARWLRAGAAGWRLDVADELPDGFLDTLRARVKSTDPDALLMGEVWEDASNKESYGHRRRYLLGRQLDSVMNYPFREAILAFVRDGGRQRFFDQVMTVAENYPPPVLRLLMNHIGTHDTERALTALGGEPANGRGRSWQAEQKMSPAERETAVRRLKLATLLQFSLPGVPCVYYGDEAGMEGYRDPFNRATYPWGHEDPDLLDWYRRLGACRRACAAFAQGEIVPLMTAEELVAYERRDGDSRLICAVNRGDTERTVLLDPAWRDARVIIGTGAVRDRVLTLPPMSGVWILPMTKGC